MLFTVRMLYTKIELYQGFRLRSKTHMHISYLTTARRLARINASSDSLLSIRESV